MKLSLNWLLELVDFKGSGADLEELLTRAGLNVESTETRGGMWEKVVVAQILEFQQHPNADRLNVCQVADGTDQPRQIVCGAKNYQVGDKVPLALPGAVLPGNFKIQVGKLRGVESHGMLCSAKELALAEDAMGLFILPKEAIVGTPVSDLFQPDSILDLEITPNRGDCLSHLGLAREVAAFTGAHLKWHPPSQTTAPIVTDPSKVIIEDGAECSLYSLRRIRKVQVAKSPTWLCSKIEAVGLKPVNNVVDITNYVMFLLGQPLHAFDAAHIKGGIIVRRAHEGEEFYALNDRKYPLKPEDLVISDSERVLAVAGVMGGIESSISGTTTEVLLESAVFKAPRIQCTSRRMELFSDSSYRFERGIDTSLVLIASEVATHLICELAGGEADCSVTVAGELSSPTSVTGASSPQVELRFNQVNRLLGLNLSPKTIQELLEKIGLHLISSSTEQVSTWEIPAFRRDLTRETDLIEEVARLIGIEQIPERTSAQPARSTPADRAADFRMALHERLTAQGFFEARTSTLIAENAFRDFIDTSNAIHLKNPLGEDQAYLRPTLLPGLLLALQRNFNYGQRAIRLYEIGKVFRKNQPEEEIPSLGLVATGVSTPPSWQNKTVRPLNFYDLKGLLQTLAGSLSFLPLSEKKNPTFPAGSLAFQILTESGEFLGVAAQLAPARCRDLGIPSTLLVAELLLQPLQTLFLSKKTFVEIPRYPMVQRDLGVVLPKSISYKNISTTLLSANEPLLFSVAPFDIFVDPTGKKLPSDRKSVAISLVFCSHERTLKSEEVTAAEQRLKQHLIQQLAAEFRA